MWSCRAERPSPCSQAKTSPPSVSATIPVHVHPSAEIDSGAGSRLGSPCALPHAYTASLAVDATLNRERTATQRTNSERSARSLVGIRTGPAAGTYNAACSLAPQTNRRGSAMSLRGLCSPITAIAAASD